HPIALGVTGGDRGAPNRSAPQPIHAAYTPGYRPNLRGLVLFLCLLFFAPAAQAWELRACAEPDNLPFSNQSSGGFENRIAGILAQELGATLSYAWVPESRITDRRLYLRRGGCDLVIGVADGSTGYLSTIAYYRSAPVFVYRQDAPFAVTSFDDEVLRELQIGVLAGAGVRPELAALANRDLIENVTSFPSLGDGNSPLAAPIEAVASGAVDVAVLWGPVGSYFAQQHPASLTVVSAQPKLDLPFLSLVVPIVMGVRPGDEALRDLLNEAIVNRWDDIQEVLEEYGVPLEPLPQPSRPQPSRPQPSRPQSGGAARGASAEDPPTLPRPVEARAGSAAETRLRIGFLLPLPTGDVPLEPNAAHLATAAARMGAVMAEEDFGGGSRSSGSPSTESRSSGSPSTMNGLEVLLSNAPSPAAARRAAERMVAANGADALVGGYGLGQAEALSQAAELLSVPFLNIGSSSGILREKSGGSYTFHVEASDRMYLDALAAGLTDAGYDRWFIAYPDTAAGRDLHRAAQAALERLPGGASEAGSLAVGDQSQLMEVVRSTEQVDAEVLVALLDWRSQLDLAALLDAVESDASFSGFPDPVSQTRTFYYSLHGAVSDPGEASFLRVALWDALLQGDGAEELNDRFLRRWGAPMEPSAWAAYESVKILVDASSGPDNSRAEGLAAVLSSPTATFELAKGAEASFRSSDHQLRQPLYLLRLNAGAQSRADLVSVVERVPFDQGEIRWSVSPEHHDLTIR
ncbi:MAG: ABC transporter substrate-binding protein, partial [Trueperaceae bacterium]